METYIRLKQHKNSTPKHKITRTKTEADNCTQAIFLYLQWAPYQTSCKTQVSLNLIANTLRVISKLPISQKKIQVGNDQEKTQSEKDSRSKNRGGKNQINNHILIQ